MNKKNAKKNEKDDEAQILINPTQKNKIEKKKGKKITTRANLSEHAKSTARIMILEKNNKKQIKK